MEHRWQKRRSLAVDVAVHFGDQILSGCRTRNVSIEGAFVDMGGMRLPKGCVVDLEVSVGNDNTTVARALVVHSGPRGTGFLLANPDRLFGAQQAEMFDAA